jgi:S1-C subfamily serine protease
MELSPMDQMPTNPELQPNDPTQQPNDPTQQPNDPTQPPTPVPWASPYPQWYTAPPRRRRRGRIVAALIGGTAAAVALGFGIGAATNGGPVVSGLGSAPAGTSVPGQPSNGASGPTQASNNAAGATAAQQTGIVDIDTVLQYQGAEAAGTGMILTSSGEVLTNNHVIDGATSIKVTVVSTGATYTAKVVGTDPTDDVAVLQLQGASGLQTAKIGNSSGVSAGDTVTAVGNAEGLGGTPAAADGSVTATGQSLTASDNTGTNAETLTNMIEINADIVPGDSGGPLYAADGSIVGMDTAASTAPGNGAQYGGYGNGGNGAVNGSSGAVDGSTAQTIAYAIPINTAVSIADQIESGHASSAIHLGYPAFLGVAMQDSSGGPVVTGVANGTPAAAAGLQAGDVITSVDGQAVTSSTSLSSIIAAHNAGDQIRLAWTDAAGQSHTATATLATGPAD